MIVDVTLNQLKKLFTAGSRLLRYEKENLIYLYYLTQSSVIFRTIIERPESDGQYQLLLTSLPQNMQVLNVIEPSTVPTLILEVLQDINLKFDQLKEVIEKKNE